MTQYNPLASIVIAALVCAPLFAACSSDGPGGGQMTPDAASTPTPATSYSDKVTLTKSVSSAELISDDETIGLTEPLNISEFLAQAKAQLAVDPAHLFIDKVEVALATPAGSVTRLEQIVANPCRISLDAEGVGGGEYEIGGISLTQGTLIANPSYGLDALNAAAKDAIKTGDASFGVHCGVAPGFAASQTNPKVSIIITMRATK